MLCAARTRSLAHNVSIADYAHGSFLKPIHFRQLWLPFLWDFVPMDYEEFLQLCNTVTQNTDDDFHFGLALDELLKSTWCWSPAFPNAVPLTVREWLSKLIESKTGMPPSSKHVVDVAISLCLTVVEAIQEFDNDVPDPRVLRCLKPSRAATVAIGRVFP